MKALLESFRKYIEDEDASSGCYDGNVSDESSESEEDDPEELEEVGMYHDPSTGYFTKRKAGAVKSLSKKGAQSAGVDPKYAERGVVTSGDKLSSKFGLNFGKKQCGRTKFPAGGKLPYKKYSCSKYNKTYSDLEEDGDKKHPLVPSLDDSESDRLDKLGYTHHLRALGRGIVRADEVMLKGEEDDLFISIEDLIALLKSIPEQRDVQLVENRAGLVQKCKEIGFKTNQEYFKSLVITLSTLKQAQDGKLGDTGK